MQRSWTARRDDLGGGFDPAERAVIDRPRSPGCSGRTGWPPTRTCWPRPGWRRTRSGPLFEMPAAAMTAALEHLDAQYGGVALYLTGAGLAAVELDQVRSNLLIPVRQDRGEE